MSEDWHLMSTASTAFDELIVDRLGAEELYVEELPVVELEALSKFDTVYGIIVHYRGSKTGSTAPVDPAESSEVKDSVYFATEEVPNASSTVAVVNLLGNLVDVKKVGPALKEFIEKTTPMDPKLRGAELNANKVLKGFQNAFATPIPGEIQSLKKETNDKEAHHYVVFLNKKGSIWELDGSKQGPIRRAQVTNDNYKTVMMDVVKNCLSDASGSYKSSTDTDSPVGVMVVTDDPTINLKKKIAEETAKGQPVDKLTEKLETLERERLQRRDANGRSLHDYTPLLFSLLKALAEKDILQPVVDDLGGKK